MNTYGQNADPSTTPGLTTSQTPGPTRPVSPAPTRETVYMVTTAYSKPKDHQGLDGLFEGKNITNYLEYFEEDVSRYRMNGNDNRIKDF